MKEFADNNSKFNENGEKFSKSIENSVEKAEIASHEQFLFLTDFSRLVLKTR